MSSSPLGFLDFIHLSKEIKNQGNKSENSLSKSTSRPKTTSGSKFVIPHSDDDTFLPIYPNLLERIQRTHSSDSIFKFTPRGDSEATKVSAIEHDPVLSTDIHMNENVGSHSNARMKPINCNEKFSKTCPNDRFPLSDDKSQFKRQADTAICTENIKLNCSSTSNCPSTFKHDEKDYPPDDKFTRIAESSPEIVRKKRNAGNEQIKLKISVDPTFFPSDTVYISDSSSDESNTYNSKTRKLQSPFCINKVNSRLPSCTVNKGNSIFKISEKPGVTTVSNVLWEIPSTSGLQTLKDEGDRNQHSCSMKSSLNPNKTYQKARNTQLKRQRDMSKKPMEYKDLPKITKSQDMVAKEKKDVSLKLKLQAKKLVEQKERIEQIEKEKAELEDKCRKMCALALKAENFQEAAKLATQRELEAHKMTKKTLHKLVIEKHLQQCKTITKVQEKTKFETVSHMKKGSQKAEPPGQKQDQQWECPVCFEPMSSSIQLAVIPCGHVFCKNCILQVAKTTTYCPICNQGFTATHVTPLFFNA